MRHVAYPVLTSLGLLLSIALLSRVGEALGVFALLGVVQQNVIVSLFVLGWVGGVTSWIMSKSVAIWSVRARPYGSEDTEKQAGDLPATIERLATRYGLRTPDLAVYPGSEANAFAVGWLRSRSLVLVTSGMLEHLSPAQAEAVLAHAIAKIANRDVSTLLLMHGMLNVFTLFPARMLAFIFGTSLRTFEDETPSDEVEIGIMLTLEVLVGTLASLLIRHYARRAESRADRDAAAVVDRQQLIGALQVLAAQAPKRSHREVFVWPVKFGAIAPRHWPALAHHLSPTFRIAALTLK